MFNVKGTSDIVRVVTLHPHETCSCPSTGECYHIQASKYSIGIPPTLKRRGILNLSKLKRNTRSRKDKKSRRKRPRPHDLDQGMCEVICFLIALTNSIYMLHITYHDLPLQYFKIHVVSQLVNYPLSTSLISHSSAIYMYVAVSTLRLHIFKWTKLSAGFCYGFNFCVLFFNLGPELLLT